MTIRNAFPRTSGNTNTKFGVKLLPEADSPPKVRFNSETGKPELHVKRKGRTFKLHISRRVAEELIASGINSVKKQ